MLAHIYEVLTQTKPTVKKSEQGFASGLGVGVDWENFHNRDMRNTDVSTCQNYMAYIYFNRHKF